MTGARLNGLAGNDTLDLGPGADSAEGGDGETLADGWFQ